MLVQPGQRRAVQLFQAAAGHHPLEGLKQGLDDNAELHSMWVKEKVREGRRRKSLRPVLTTLRWD